MNQLDHTNYDYWGKYNYINTMDLLRQVNQFLMNPDGTPKYKVMSIDTETNGLRLYKNSVVGFSFSIDDKKGWYVPLVEWIPDTTFEKKRTINKKKYDIFPNGHFRCVWTGNIYEEFFQPHEYKMPEFIPALLYRWFSKVNSIYHNAPFDINHIFILFGIDLKDSLFLDTALLSHILNENTPNGLKETATEWKDDLGINPYQLANQEQKELGLSVIRNGGEVTKGGKPKTVWRASPDVMCKYACADTFLTFGLYKVGLKRFIDEFGEKQLDWLFQDEVMPVCREVVIPMKRNGVYIDVEHFKKLEQETGQMLLTIEDELMEHVNPFLDEFTIGKSLDEAISNQRLIKRIIELENLAIPTKLDKKTGIEKETLAKPAVKKAYQENPHWLWGYILGEDELKYSDAKVESIKKQLYYEVEGRRYRFNVGSDDHLRWLFCEKLGMSAKDLPQTDSATSTKIIPSMAAEVLKEHMLPKFPWVSRLLTFKKLRKLHSTYMKPAVELNINGWLYMDMRQNGTKSGRFACSGGFNLQTLPSVEAEMESLDKCSECGHKELQITHPIQTLADTKCPKCGHEEKDIICPSVIKVGFIAPPGYKIVNADYSSLEPRCFAFVSGDAKLKEVYWKDLDLYSKVYCDMFDDENKYSADPKDENFLKKVNKSARTSVKPIVLGIPYGANKYQVAQLTGATKTYTKDDGTVVNFPDTEYGQSIIDRYLNTYSDLRKYMEKCEMDCLQKGYVETLIGRRRHFMYAPKIYRFLVMNSITVQDILEAKNNQLNKKDTQFTSAYGNEIKLNVSQLKALIKEMGLPWERACEKGFWLYVKNLLKADLNNSKNHPIQGLAGSTCNKGMLDTTRKFKTNGVDGWVNLQIHDEITCYVREDQVELGAKCLQEGMEDNQYTKLLDVAMIAEPLICDNLKDAK